MSISYCARPRAFIEDQEQQMMIARNETPMVFEPENNSRNTGLIDMRGNPIYAVTQIDPVGFIPVQPTK